MRLGTGSVVPSWDAVSTKGVTPAAVDAAPPWRIHPASDEVEPPRGPPWEGDGTVVVVAEMARWTESSSVHREEDRDERSVWDLDEDSTEDATIVCSSRRDAPYEDETVEALRHQRRSQASLQRFHNATWKAQWYQRRWGGSDRRRRAVSPMDRRARQIPASFLSQLAVWEEEQLATAMRNYRWANQRRSRSRRRTNERRRQFFSWAVRSTEPAADPSAPPRSRFQYHDAEEDEEEDRPSKVNDRSRPKVFSSFLVPETHQPNPALQELQRRRSAQAQRAYQQRAPPSSPPRPLRMMHQVRRPLPGTTLTPQEALMVTEQLLQSPSKLDQNPELLAQLLKLVQIIQQPAKLSQRHAILCRIVRQVLNVRGRCIPMVRPGQEEGATTTTYQFMTKASVSVLGSFVLERIQLRLDELAANQADPVA
jgi:hypothetical protein